MPQDRAPVRVVDQDRLDHVPVGDRAGQVAQLAVDPRGDDRVRAGGLLALAGCRERRTRRRASLGHMLASGESEAKRLR